MVSDLTQQKIELSAELKKYHDGWATEVIEQQKDSLKWWRRIAIALLIGFLATNAYWIAVQNSYDFVYQDGAGQNNYNQNIDGDVNNVTTDKEETKR